MSISGDYTSIEKEKIREKLWDPAIEDILKNTEKESFKYFTLPGSQCIEIQRIFKKYDLGPRNVIAVEQNQECSIPIRFTLQGKGCLFEGTLEEICKNNELDKVFPFDMVNLDFCGQAFLFKEDSYQERWNSIKYFIKGNEKADKERFYLLLTVLGARSNRSGKNFLLQTIQDLNDSTGMTKDPIGEKWKEDRTTQEALPKIMINLALEHDYNVEKIASYRYQQAGSKSRMVAFAFKLNRIDHSVKDLASSISSKQALMEKAQEYYLADAKRLII